METMEITMIAVEKLVASTNSIQKHTPNALKTLKNSILYHGKILEPMRVHPSEDGNDRFVVDDGNARLEVIQKINKGRKEKMNITCVPCVISNLYDPYIAPETKQKKGGDTDKETAPCSDKEEEKSLNVKAHYAALTVNLCKGKVDKEKLGKEILHLRNDLELGYGAIAQRTGLSRSGVKKIIEGGKKKPQTSKISTGELSRMRGTLNKLKGSLSEAELTEYGNAFDLMAKFIQGQLEAREKSQKSEAGDSKSEK